MIKLDVIFCQIIFHSYRNVNCFVGGDRSFGKSGPRLELSVIRVSITWIPLSSSSSMANTSLIDGVRIVIIILKWRNHVGN